jgi:hypothetical protein
MFICCDCRAEIKADMDTMPNADHSATVQCVSCHTKSHETSNGQHSPTRRAYKKNSSECWICSQLTL